MPHLSLSFLGGFEVTLDTEPVTTFGTVKSRALLAFLAIEASRPHRRAALSAMFWPDTPEKKAAHNLSQSLLCLRYALREMKDDRTNAAPGSLLITTTQDVQFNTGAKLQPAAGLPVSEQLIWLPSQGERRRVTTLVCGHGPQADDELDARREKLHIALTYNQLDTASNEWLLSLLLGLLSGGAAPETINKAQREQMRLASLALARSLDDQPAMALALAQVAPGL